MEIIKYNFNPSKRYLTRGVSQRLPLELQIIIWSMVDEIVNSDINADYLQVFKFNSRDNNFIITHYQEQPEYKKEYQYVMKETYRMLVNQKIYIIDDIDHSTMLWSDEY